MRRSIQFCVAAAADKEAISKADDAMLISLTASFISEKNRA
jgi:hypothetical protein